MSPRPLKQDNVPFYLLEHQTNSQPVGSGRLIIKRPLEGNDQTSRLCGRVVKSGQNNNNNTLWNTLVTN